MRAYNSWLRASKRHPADLPQPRRVDPVLGVEATPKLPHERDQSLSSQASRPRKVIRQAQQDIDNGLVDTDRRSSYGMGDDVGLRSKRHHSRSNPR
ncbi:hypothetical protein [Chitinimonas sp. BJB300]|uniref:hypothetical protein n=1 Tax=Chitinimonas sp. BJB300 TaxID=1559339 RepID=UPI000C0C811D|nr:hypothetical protein [Chitinimonas sp. BJB300]PHV10147.1 hypothetical protein CSQ89_17730 [Chitinimonas sp. BJB300]TSJ86130.1 hypothetical protein FG002_016515 [Chitinimonas sp. BJB300]